MFVSLTGVFKNAFGRVKPSDGEENSEFVPNRPDFMPKNETVCSHFYIVISINIT